MSRRLKGSLFAISLGVLLSLTLQARDSDGLTLNTVLLNGHGALVLEAALLGAGIGDPEMKSWADAVLAGRCVPPPKDKKKDWAELSVQAIECKHWGGVRFSSPPFCDVVMSDAKSVRIVGAAAYQIIGALKEADSRFTIESAPNKGAFVTATGGVECQINNGPDCEIATWCNLFGPRPTICR